MLPGLLRFLLLWLGLGDWQVRSRRALVRDIWILSGLFMLWLAQPPLMMAVALFSTCLSFCVLDEGNWH
ncbi:hypothetical protein GCM10011348_19380 [Marinobacterium nitratireducens]|uniref:Uncharacterized protein n=1 Tax=Marinobacterium nitratireducens TaxID=518897 RepID=A0A918DSJ0_9GAMM|nr:hypothetical protein [Marinobacterium nitratireducens]GGO81103.1 hypothetical protein GCM10011348_19380 [Marinobacterium nitratireducens]